VCVCVCVYACVCACVCVCVCVCIRVCVLYHTRSISSNPNKCCDGNRCVVYSMLVISSVDHLWSIPSLTL